ncbi:MAG TPA: hypothetical protein VFB60_16825 [Ktedonobacteraceae bacterium]|nr:hypothetical protein [Ktedonobacteraceae bacterium]
MHRYIYRSDEPRQQGKRKALPLQRNPHTHKLPYRPASARPIHCRARTWNRINPPQGKRAAPQ